MNTKQQKDLLFLVNNAVQLRNSPTEQESGQEEDDPNDEEFLARLPKLPLGLKESLVGVPDKVKMPILAAVMPLAMSYATDVEVRYCDGKNHRLNCMTIVFGRQASGKSSVKDVLDIWKSPMKEADQHARAAAKETRSCIDFAIVMAEYALKYQSELFGSQLLEVGTAVSDTGYKTRNKSLFDELPPSFTFADIKTARPDARDNTLRVMIYTWKREGRIVPTELNCWKKL